MLGKAIIAGNVHHADYDLTVEISDKYDKIVTGKGIEELLQQFHRREDSEQFMQRVALSNITVPANVHRVMQPVARLKNLKPQTNDITPVEDTPASRYYLDNVENYNSGQSLHKYVTDNIIEFSNIDPNAYLINSFIQDGDNTRMITTLARSKDVMNYKKDLSGNLEWLLCKYEKETQEIVKDKYTTIRSIEYIFYHSDFDIVFTQTRNETGATKIGGSYYIITAYQHEGTGISAYKIGVKVSHTNKNVCVPFIAEGEEIIMKLIQQISECDLTRRLHAFPRMYEYLPECPGVSGNVCMRGYDNTGAICKACNGTGHSTHKSTQDKVVLTMPTNPEKMFDLSMLQAYANMPVDTFKFMFELVEKYSDELLKTIYNKNIFEVNSVQQTATAAMIDMQSVFDALIYFTDRIKAVYKNSLKDYAKYINIDVDVQIEYPYNLNLIGYEGLISILQEARNAGASNDSLAKINEMIEQSLYGNSMDELTKIKTKRYFSTLSNKNADEVQMYLNSNLVSDFDKALYYNIDRIFMKIDMEQPNFYTSTTDKQWQIITNYVDTIIAEQVPPVVIPDEETAL